MYRYKIENGITHESYGLSVAKLAGIYKTKLFSTKGVPNDVIDIAHEFKTSRLL